MPNPDDATRPVQAKEHLTRRPFGRAGFETLPFGFGGAQIGGANVSDEEAVATVRRALELGIEFVDTCTNYGESSSHHVRVHQ